MFADPPERYAPPPPPALEAPRWTVGDLVVGFVAILAVVGAVVGLLIVVRPRGFAAGVIATIAVEVAVGLIVLALAWRRGISLRGLGFVAPPSWWPVVGLWFASYSVLFAYMLGLAVLDGAGMDVARFEGGNPIPLPLPRDGASSLAVAGLAVAVVLVAPVAEELYFRAFLFRAARRWMRLTLAALLSGALFAVFHGNLAVVVPFTFVGALFAWGFESSGSLWTSIAAHFLVNGLGFVATLSRLTERG